MVTQVVQQRGAAGDVPDRPPRRPERRHLVHARRHGREQPGDLAGELRPLPRRRGHRPGRRIVVRRTGAGAVPGGLAGLLSDRLNLDQVVRRAAQDVTQSRQNVHRQPLRRPGDQAEHLLPRQGDPALGQQRHQVGGMEHILLSHPQPQMPADPHLPDHDGSPHRSP
jgi:hypothetical protein